MDMFLCTRYPSVYKYEEIVRLYIVVSSAVVCSTYVLVLEKKRRQGAREGNTEERQILNVCWQAGYFIVNSGYNWYVSSLPISTMCSLLNTPYLCP